MEQTHPRAHTGRQPVVGCTWCTGKRLCSRLGCHGGPGSEGCAAAVVQQPAEGESEREAWLFPGLLSQEHGF